MISADALGETKARKPRFGGLGPALALSIVAIASSWYAGRVGSGVLHSFSALLIYLNVLITPGLASLLGILLFSVASIVSSPEAAPNIVRIAVFSLMLEASMRDKRTIPPFLVLIILWSAFIALGSFPAVSKFGFAKIDGDLFRQIFIELLGVLGATLLRLRYDAAQSQTSGKRGLDTKTFFVHVVGLAVLLGVLCACAGLMASSGSSFDSIVKQLLQKPHQLIASSAIVVMIATAAGLFLAMIIGNFIRHLHAIISPDGNFSTAPTILPLLEFDRIVKQLVARVRKTTEESRKAERTISELRRISQHKEEVIRERELSALNMMKLMDGAPWGAVSCSANGLIITANKTFGDIINVPHTSLPGEHISKLDTPHPWCKEMHRLLVWGCRDYSKLLQQGPVHHFASSVDKHYLDCSLRITRAVSGEGAVCASDVAITLFVRKLPDVRNFQLTLLAPSGFDLVGSQTNEFVKQLRNRNSSIVSRLSMLDSLLNKPHGTSGWIMRQTEIGTEMLVQLNELSNLARETEDELANFEEILSPRENDIEEFPVHTNLSHAINYLFDLLALEDRDRVKISKTELEQAPGKNDVSVIASRTEMNKFVAYFLAMTKHLHTKAPAIEIDVAYEQIDAHAAKIIPGSQPGDYARITLMHAGQSLTANMMTSKFSYLDPSSRIRGDSEVALSLLNMQVSRLNGFVSVQSTASKGTIVTIYIPVIARDSEREPAPENAAKSKKHFRRKRFDDLSAAGNSAIVVGTDSQVTAAVENLLKHLEYECKVINPATTTLDGGRAVGFGGSGFGEGTSTDVLGDAEQPKDETSQSLAGADLLIINLEGDLSQALNLIHRLEERTEHAATLLVADPSPKIEQAFGDWALLRKPIDLAGLEGAIKEAKSRV